MKIQLGGIWLDDARIPYENENEKDFVSKRSGDSGFSDLYIGGIKKKLIEYNADNNGRFPANMLVSDDILNDIENYSRYFDLDKWFDIKT